MFGATYLATEHRANATNGKNGATNHATHYGTMPPMVLIARETMLMLSMWFKLIYMHTYFID
jgi:hypothetical protein